MSFPGRIKRAIAAAIKDFSSESGDSDAKDPGDNKTEKTEDAVQTGAPAGPSPSVYTDSLKQWSTAMTWLIGALAAVAAAMIAGSQLSSIGELSAEHNGDRLFRAGGGIVVAVALILLAVALMFWAQGPSNTDFIRLQTLAGGTGTKRLDRMVRRQVEEDSSLNRGTASLAHLMTDLQHARTRYYTLRNQRYEKALAAARETDTTKKKEAEAARDRLGEELELVDEHMTQYRLGLLRVAQLDAFLRTRRKYRQVSATVTVLAVLATLAFVNFAWAANPS